VIYDTEYTAWPGSYQRRWSGPGEHRELVQIGAVALDAARDFAELAAFDLLVRPRINPVLSEYFVALTGIANADVTAHGLDLPEALAAFVDFIGARPAYSFGGDDAILRENCVLRDIPYPFGPGAMLDCRPEVIRLAALDPAQADSGNLPALMGFPAAGPKHQGLSDARAVAGALRQLRQRRLL
jgi:inhibitor of KinA sporulation pathway (predicted exonuclease)